MFKTTRTLIDARSKFARRPLEVVKVRHIPIATPGSCLENSNAAVFQDVCGSGSVSNPTVGGWIVYPYNKQFNVTEIVQHWWNFDPVLGEYFDTTPFDETVPIRQAEYVMDPDFRQFIIDNTHKLSSAVGKDIALVEGRWVATEFPNGEPVTHDLPNLDTRNLVFWLAPDGTRSFAL